MITILIPLTILTGLINLISIIATSCSIATLGLTDVLSIKLTLSLFGLVFNFGFAAILIAFQKAKSSI